MVQYSQTEFKKHQAVNAQHLLSIIKEADNCGGGVMGMVVVVVV